MAPQTAQQFARSSPVLGSALLGVLSFAAAAQEVPAGADPFAAGRAARDGGRYRMLLRQFRAEEPALPDRHVAGFCEATAAHGAERDLPAAHWVWVRPFWFLFRDGPGAQDEARAWGPERACGAPDTPEPGDHQTAFATLEPDGGPQWLLLEYAAPVRAAVLVVHESFNPGALAAVAILDPAGREIEVWRGTAGKVEEAARTLRIDLPLGFLVERVKLRLECAAVPGWNEIDAVGLQDDRGTVHWAARAAASSTYAERDAGGGRAAVAVPVPAPGLPGGAAAAPAARPPEAEAARAARAARIAELEEQIEALQQELARLRAEQARRDRGDR